MESEKRIEAASIKMPPEWEKREEVWRELTFGGRLFERLSQCLRRRASVEELQVILKDLDEWEEFASDIPHGKHQSGAARTLVQLALLAAKQPNPSAASVQQFIEAEQLQRICLGGLGAVEWDAVCALSSTPRRAISTTARSVSVLLEQGNIGCLALLEVELIADGAGEIYPDPQRVGFIEFDQETFLKSATEVWEQVKQEVTRKPEEREQLESVDARFRLRHLHVPQYHNPRLVAIKGRSAQAAFHLCLLQAARAYLGEPDVILLDQSVAVSATVEDGRKLGSVGALESKLEAAYLKGLAIVIVAKADEAKAKQALAAVKACKSVLEYGSAVEVIGVETIAETVGLLRDRAKEKEAIRRYERERSSQLDILDRLVPIEAHYQVLPLLREVKKEKLPSQGAPEEQSDETADAGLRSVEVQRWEEELRAEQITYEQHSLHDVLSDFRRVVEEAKSAVPRFFVLGPPGSGKTTLAQYLAWACSEQRHEPDSAAPRLASELSQHLVPARVQLRDWEAWATKSSNPEHSLPEYLAARYKDIPHAPTAEQWRCWLRRGEVLLLLDGLDEIAGKPLFIEALKSALATFKDCPTLLTCRTVSFEQHRALSPEFPIFILAGLDDTQREAHIRAFPARNRDRFDPNALIDQLNRTPQMRPLAANPLLLSIVCYVVDDPKGVALPATRADLYGQAVEKLLMRRKRVEVCYPGEEPEADEKRAILERVALNLFARDDRALSFTGAELGEELKRALSEGGYGQAPAPWANALRADLTHNSGILRGSSEQGYFFLHLTIQEYLAAAALARLVNQSGWEAAVQIAGRKVTPYRLVDCKSWNPRWQEVMVLLAGQLRDSGPLLKLLADEEKDDYFRHRLALAALCLPELKSEICNSQATIINQITTTAFLFWWEHCAETDVAISHLTKTLPALAQVDGEVDGIPLLTLLCKWLRDEDRKESLRTADVLVQMGKVATRHPDVIPTLIECALHNEDQAVRSRAVGALGQIDETAARHPDVLPALVSALRDEERAVRYSAADLLLRMGEAAAQHPEVVPALVEYFLREENLSLHEGISKALVQMGEAAAQHPEVVPALVTALRDEEALARERAVNALSRMGAAAVQHPEVVPALVECFLREEDSRVHYWVSAALKEIGEAVARHLDTLPTLVSALRDKDGRVRARAAEVLGQIGEAAARHPDVLPTLVCTLRDEEVAVRGKAADALGEMGGAAAQHTEVLPTLVAALRDKNHSVHNSAAKALASMDGAGAQHPDVFPTLITALHDKESDMRCGVLLMLCYMGEAAARHPDALLALVSALRNKEPHLRSMANHALGQIGKAAARHPDVLTALVATLRDEDQAVRSEALSVLGELGEVAAQHPDVLPALVSLLRNEDQAVRSSAAWALGKMGEAAAQHPEVFPTLIAALHDKDEAVRFTAAEALLQMGEAAARHPDVIPTLIAALRDEHRNVRWRAAGVLEEMGEAIAQHPDALPALVTVLRECEEDSWVRLVAARALRRMGETAMQHPDVLHALGATLRDDNPDVRSIADGMLRQVGEATAWHPDVLPMLVAALRNDDQAMRSWAVGVLGRMDKAAAQHPDVVPILVAALRDEDWGARARAIQVLRNNKAVREAAARHPDVPPALITALRDKEPEVRSMAAEALLLMGGATARHPDVLSPLINALPCQEEYMLNGEIIILPAKTPRGVREVARSFVNMRIFKRQADTWEWESVAELSQW